MYQIVLPYLRSTGEVKDFGSASRERCRNHGGEQVRAEVTLEKLQESTRMRRRVWHASTTYGTPRPVADPCSRCEYGGNAFRVACAARQVRTAWMACSETGQPEPANPGWWEIDVDALGLGDGAYEYEFILDGHTGQPVPDPFADESYAFRRLSRRVSHLRGAADGSAFPMGMMSSRWLALLVKQRHRDLRDAGEVDVERPRRESARGAWHTGAGYLRVVGPAGGARGQLYRAAADRNNMLPRHSTGGTAHASTLRPITTWGRPSTRGFS